MCGIAGVLDPRGLSSDRYHPMVVANRYRGRDEEGSWTDGHQVLLQHSRLAIIDADGGRQPMTDETGRYTIVYSGEVYNHIELRATLQAQGARFRTRSDTEVVLEGFRLRGPAICESLNGMFAFAVWDAVAKELFLARDQLGKKPLFWANIDDAFCFSSTLDAFLGLRGFDPSLSARGVAAFRLFGSFPEDVTIYEAASAVPYGSWATIRAGDPAPSVHRYWRMSFDEKLAAPAETLEQRYLEVLEDAVRIRLRSDLPLALTFSGGVDSGTIAAVAAERLAVRLQCFTIDRHTATDPSAETITAERVARHLGLDWRYIDFDYEQDLLAELDGAYRWYDQPSQQLPLVYVDELYRTIKPHATVVLSGNGADELFTGYVGDERIRRQDLLLKLARPVRAFLPDRLSPYLRQEVPLAYRTSTAVRAEAFHAEDLSGVVSVAETVATELELSGVRNRLDLGMFLSLTSTATDANFRLPDISGLAHQVEVRSPFLDHRMVAFAAALPHRLKVGRPWTPSANKFLPRRAYEAMVPRDVAWAPKRGMGWNLRWDLQLAGPGFATAFESAFASLDDHGLSSEHPRLLHRRHVEASAAGGAGPELDALVTSFMLGRWLQRTVPAGR